jgi:two-component system OmpR family sensor kinase
LEGLLAAAARGAETLAEPRSVTVTVRCPEELTVRADPDRLRQAVDIVLENATHHSPPGGRVEVVATGLPDGAVLLTVHDSGPGFPVDFLPHAFERFQRADAGRPRDSGGTGLGLAIAAAIVHAHGGGITASNAPSGGAVVSVQLPGEDAAAPSGPSPG